MNERAAQLGMTNTTFLNCTGLPATGHVTTAYDIALMSRELLRHDTIKEYTTIWLDTVRNGGFQLANTNKLIRFYDGATGLKTGFTNPAMFCLSATAEREGMELIAVILHAETSDKRFETAKSLLNYGFANYCLTEVHPDRALPPIDVHLGTQETVQPVLTETCRLLAAKTDLEKITHRAEKKGQVMKPETELEMGRGVSNPGTLL
jgi:D-alanyl-D-alanine carboxypeptidase (penicillin-binding protein 5/6)